MRQMPLDKGLDSSIALLSEGYTFISKRCQRYHTDVFQTRFLLQSTICMRGKEAAQIFYDPDRFVRAGATPKRVNKTLFGQGGVQGLDGAAHGHRKAMFMALMTSAEVGRLVDLTTAQWRAYVEEWTAGPQACGARFRQRDEDPFDYIPQGGGGHYLNHRCAGEWATVALMKGLTECLTQSMNYVVPAQDLTVDLSHMPAMPASRFIISDVTAR